MYVCVCYYLFFWNHAHHANQKKIYDFSHQKRRFFEPNWDFSHLSVLAQFIFGGIGSTMATKPAVCGIDFGASESYVAYVGKGIVDIVQNEAHGKNAKEKGGQMVEMLDGENVGEMLGRFDAKIFL